MEKILKIFTKKKLFFIILVLLIFVFCTQIFSQDNGKNTPQEQNIDVINKKLSDQNTVTEKKDSNSIASFFLRKKGVSSFLSFMKKEENLNFKYPAGFVAVGDRHEHAL